MTVVLPTLVHIHIHLAPKFHPTIFTFAEFFRSFRSKSNAMTFVSVRFGSSVIGADSIECGSISVSRLLLMQANTASVGWCCMWLRKSTGEKKKEKFKLVPRSHKNYARRDRSNVNEATKL